MQSNAIRKRALLIGAAWTLAWLRPGAIQVLPVCADIPFDRGPTGVGVGGRIAPRARCRTTRSGCRLRTRDVVDALAQAMGVEMQRAGQELVRVRELLEHAIDRRIEAFNGVSDYMQRQELMQAGEVDLF